MGNTVSILFRRCFGIFQLEERKVVSVKGCFENGAICKPVSVVLPGDLNN